MKVVNISKFGIDKRIAKKEKATNGKFFYMLTHGEEGRGRWQVRFPLGAKDYPCYENSAITLDISQEDFKLININKKDKKGNDLYILGKGYDDGSFLVMWNLNPGFRGGASYKLEGQAVLIAEAEEAQGDAGRMGGAVCPIVLVSGPCKLKWKRTGRLYGDPSDWVCEFDGKVWRIAPETVNELEDAVFNN